MAFPEHVLRGAVSSRICGSAIICFSASCTNVGDSSNLKSCGCSCKLTSGSHVVGCKSSSGKDFGMVAENQRSLLVRTLAIVPVSSHSNTKGSAGSLDANEQKKSNQRKSNDRRSFIGKMTSLSLFSISLGPLFCESAGATSNFWNGSEGNGGHTAKVVRKKPVLITLAAYAVTKVAYEKITHLFAEHWLKENGQEVKFRLSLAGSGAQARAVIDGLPADIVSLALPLDVLKIEEAGLIESDWQKRVPNYAVPAETTVCIVTRPGNPKNITDWQDLARSDVSCLTANPKTAGVARWNFLALWGSVTVEGGSEEEAQTLIENVFRNVPVEPRDAREVSDVFFKQGLGDAMITYENEIFLTNEKIVESRGEALPYTIPPLNVRVEMSIAVVDKNARRSGVHEVAEAFVNYCFTEPAQREYARSGFRPYLQSVADEFNIIPVEKPWKVEEQVGDWLHVQEKFFADKGMIDVIEQNIRASRLGA